MSASALEMIMLSSYCVCSRNSPCTKWTDSLVRVDVCGHITMVVRIDSIGQQSPTNVGNPSLAYEFRSVASGCVPSIYALAIRC